MALFDIKKLKENVTKSTEGIMKSISDTAEKLPESTKNFNLADSMKGAATKGQAAFDILKAKGEEALSAQQEKKVNTKTAIKDALSDQRSKEAVLSIRDALHIMYCLMAIDGTISEEETDKFDEIGKACDPDFAAYRDGLVEECLAAARMETVYGHSFVPETPEEEEDYYNQIHDYVGDLFKENSFYATDGMRGKILIWNLLAIAFSEGDYSANERRLIRYIARRAGVDHTVLLEMEHTISTLSAIEKEEEWLKSTDKPYKVVGVRINELADRKNMIMQGVNALIAD